MTWLTRFLCIFAYCSQSNLSEDVGSAGSHPFGSPGMKLEAVMEHLQRQQEAKVEMNLQEKHLLQAQLLFAQQAAAAAAAARASGSRLDSAFLGKADVQPYPAAQPGFRHQSGMDPEGDGEDSDKDEQEMVEEHDEVEEDDDDDDDDDDDGDEEENDPQMQAKRPRFQPAAGFPFLSYSTAGKQMESPLPVAKQEQEEKDIPSPRGQQTFTSPNGFTDWGYDEPYRQVSGL